MLSCVGCQGALSFSVKNERTTYTFFGSFWGSVCSVPAHAPNPHVQPIFSAERVTPWNVRLRLTLAVALRACPPTAAAAGTRRDQKGQLPPGRGDCQPYSNGKRPLQEQRRTIGGGGFALLQVSRKSQSRGKRWPMERVSSYGGPGNGEFAVRCFFFFQYDQAPFVPCIEVALALVCRYHQRTFPVKAFYLAVDFPITPARSR